MEASSAFTLAPETAACSAFSPGLVETISAAIVRNSTRSTSSEAVGRVEASSASALAPETTALQVSSMLVAGGSSAVLPNDSPLVVCTPRSATLRRVSIEPDAIQIQIRHYLV